FAGSTDPDHWKRFGRQSVHRTDAHGGAEPARRRYCFPIQVSGGTAVDPAGEGHQPRGGGARAGGDRETGTAVHVWTGVYGRDATILADGFSGGPFAGGSAGGADAGVRRVRRGDGIGKRGLRV